MPPGSKIEPLKLFRTLVQSPEIASRLRVLGAGILGPHSLIAPREREILIHRTAARFALERPDRRHAGEHERRRTADPNRCGQQMHDDENALHRRLG